MLEHLCTRSKQASCLLSPSALSCRDKAQETGQRFHFVLAVNAVCDPLCPETPSRHSCLQKRCCMARTWLSLLFPGVTLIVGLFEDRNIIDKLVFQQGLIRIPQELDLWLVFVLGYVLGTSLIRLWASSSRKCIRGGAAMSLSWQIRYSSIQPSAQGCLCYARPLLTSISAMGLRCE